MKLAKNLLVLFVLVCACTDTVAGGWLGNGAKADDETPATEVQACRVHTGMVTPAALKTELPADEAAIKVGNWAYFGAGQMIGAPPALGAAAALVPAQPGGGFPVHLGAAYPGVRAVPCADGGERACDHQEHP